MLTCPPGWIFIGPYIVPVPIRVRCPLIGHIQENVASYYRIPLIEMKSSRRAREVARPRQVAMFLSREMTRRSLPEIGRHFGDRDHTTVIHACRKIKELRVGDAEIDRDVRRLMIRIRGLA